MSAKPGQEQIDITTVQKTDRVTRYLQIPYIRQAGRIKSSTDSNPFCICTCQFFHTSGGNDSSFPYNRGPAAETLDFGENVGRKEHRHTLFVSFLQYLKEFPLHQGIQSPGWFIQDTEQWIMLQGTDNGQLLPVSKRKFADQSRRIQLQALAQVSGCLPAVFPAQVRRKPDQVPSSHIRIEICFRRKIPCYRQNLFFIF